MNTDRKIMPGMLIRKLRASDAVVTKWTNMGVKQYLTPNAEVRWLWDPETDWVRVID